MTVRTLLLIPIIAFSLPTIAQAQTPEPGGTPEDAIMALRNPDEYAWKLFLFLNRQAAPGTAGEVDLTRESIREYDDDIDVVWESWALTSGLDLDFSGGNPPFPILGNASEVFKNPATQPVPWDDLPRGQDRNKLLSQDFKSVLPLLSAGEAMFFNMSAHGTSFSAERFPITIAIAPLGSSPAEDETRMNRSTYDTIREEGLYSVEGVERAALTAREAGRSSLVGFEPGSKEVKARWIHLEKCDTDSNCSDKGRYHWRTVTNDSGEEEVWGLAALHIITKDLPNWFWSDFGHIDCENGIGACAGFTAQTPRQDLTTTDTDGVRVETAGSKWEFYRLRGAQGDFVETNGIDSVLSNPVIEATFQRSSCITCHSYASSASQADVVNRGTSLPIFAGMKGVRNVGSQSFDTGKPNCQRFFSPGGNPTLPCAEVFDDSSPIYFQTDFLWSIPFRAFSEVSED